MRSHRGIAGARTTCTSVAYGIGLISITVAVFESKYCARSQENEHQNEANTGLLKIAPEFESPSAGPLDYKAPIFRSSIRRRCPQLSSIYGLYVPLYARFPVL